MRRQEPHARPGWIARVWERHPWLALGASLVAVMVLALAGYAVASSTAHQRASRKLDEATRILEQADKLVVRIDTVVSSEITSALAEPAESAAADVESAAGRLREATALLNAATPNLAEADQVRAQYLTAAVNARRDMLAQAPSILSANAKAAKALPSCTDAWTQTLLAKTDSDKAVAQYNKLTPAGVKASSRLNTRAATELAQARRLFVAAEDAFPEADFEPFIAYVDLRIEINALSRESDKAWLDDDLAKANRNTKVYNTKDAEAVALAKRLPVSPAQAVADAYDEAVSAATDEYFAARARATKADANLRGR